MTTQYTGNNGKMSFGTIILVLCMICCASSVVNSLVCGNIPDAKGKNVCSSVNSGLCCLACLYLLAFKTR